MRRLTSERAQLSRLRANIPRPPTPDTLAERITRFVGIKHKQDQEDQESPIPFDWPATYEWVRRMILERGDDPDRPA
jgi:hypothetical protein